MSEKSPDAVPKDLSNENAFRLMELDFEQRSQQIIQLSLDRSRFQRLQILIWSAPIVVTAGVKNVSAGDDANGLLQTGLIIGGAFIVASILNIVSLCAIIGNRNTTNLCATFVNYVRRYYFHRLISAGKFSETDKSKRFLKFNDDNLYDVIYVQSGSTDLGIYLSCLANLLYALVGTYLISDRSYFIAAMMFACILISYVLALTKMTTKDPYG